MKTEFIELAAAWKSRTENSTICSGPLSGVAKMIMGLPLGQDARLILQHNTKKGENERAPDYRFVLVVSDEKNEDKPAVPTENHQVPF